MPHVSDRGLRYALQGATRGGDRAAAACYLADRCLLEGSGIKALEAEADVWEKNTEDKLRKAQEAERVLEEAKRRDKAERETFKDRIVRRYADEVSGIIMVCGPNSNCIMYFKTAPVVSK